MYCRLVRDQHVRIEAITSQPGQPGCDSAAVYLPRKVSKSRPFEAGPCCTESFFRHTGTLPDLPLWRFPLPCVCVVYRGRKRATRNRGNSFYSSLLGGWGGSKKRARNGTLLAAKWPSTTVSVVLHGYALGSCFWFGVYCTPPRLPRGTQLMKVNLGGKFNKEPACRKSTSSYVSSPISPRESEAQPQHGDIRYRDEGKFIGRESLSIDLCFAKALRFEPIILRCL